MGYLSDPDASLSGGLTPDEAAEVGSAVAKASSRRPKTGKGSGSSVFEEPPIPQPGVDDRALYAELCRKNGGDASKALFEFCFHKNVFYNHKLAKPLVESTDDAVRNAMPAPYLEAIAARPEYDGLDFLSQIKRENFEKIYSEDLSLLTLSPDDRKNRQQILSIVNYDPFADEPDEDKPQMYRDLAGLLTDAMRRDIPKRNAAIEVVHDYTTIARYQRRKAAYELDDDGSSEKRKQIDNCVSMISKMQDTINKLTKENGFSAGRNVGANGRGGLSDVMTMCEERGYDKESANLYDIKTSAAIEQVATISFRALLNQVNFSGTDYAGILAEQCKKVREYREIALKSQEMARLACEKLEKQTLLEEYRAELSKKGISEEDIQEMVDREIDMVGEDF